MKSRNDRRGGFTLVEVVVASALLCLLVAASYVAVSQTMYAARLMSQRVSAQGMCMALFEDLRGLPFDAIFPSDAEAASAERHYIQERREYLMAQGLGPGATDVNIEFNTNAVSGGGPDLNYRDILIVTTWTFPPPFASATGQGGAHSEELRGAIFNLSPRVTQNNTLNINHLALNPHQAEGQNYSVPQYLRIVAENGVVYTQSDLANGGVPSSLRAVSVTVCPGGGGEQEGVAITTKNGTTTLKNAKKYGFFSNGMSESSLISVQINESGGKYFMNLYCDDAKQSLL